jgi:hypothetical protein
MFGLTKQQQTFAIVIILAVVAYFLFFRKRGEQKTSGFGNSKYPPFETGGNTDAGL